MRIKLMLICVLLGALFLPLGMVNADNSDHSNGDITTVARGLNKPFGLFFDGDHLLVTNGGHLLRIRNPEIDMHPFFRVIERVSPIGEGDGLGAMLHGSKYMVLSCDAGCPRGSARLQEISLDGTVVDIAQNIDQAVDIARFGDNFLVSVTFLNQILKITPTGDVSVFTTDKLNSPASMYVDGERVWVTNFLSGDLLVIDRRGKSKVVASGLGTAVGIATDGLDFIIADFAFEQPNRGRVLRVSRTGDVRVIAGPGSIGNPSAVVVRGADIYVSDFLNGKVMRIRGKRLKPIHCHGRDCD
jgi:DNA-binding beta-propeller fold protein YncE